MIRTLSTKVLFTALSLLGLHLRAQTPFDCEDSMIFYSGSPGGNTTLYDVKYNASPLTRDAIGAATRRYNAIGFNTGDGFVYGINDNLGANSNRLLKISNDGSVEDLGAVAGLPTQSTNEYNAGDFDAAGNLYVMHNGTSTMYRIDITNMTATAVPLSPAEAISLSDIAYHDGLFYGIRNSNSQLVSVNPATGAVTNIGTVHGTGVFGAMMGACNGIFGIANEGGFYQFDIATGARTKLANTPSALSGVDGAHCHTACIETGALPVSLISFEAYRNGENAVELLWATASEKNNAGFDIERSANGRSWTKLGFVEGRSKSESSLKLNYNFIDTAPLNGKNYYRLKQVDVDGRYEYSKFVVADIRSGKGNLLVFPNPTASNRLTLKLSDSEILSVGVFSLTGIQMRVGQLQSDGTIDIRNLPAGHYFLRVTGENGEVVTKGFIVK